MPQATDLVINNGAGTPVAKTFSLINPAGGLGSVAEWQLKEGAISTVFPTITWAANRNTKTRSRKGQGKFVLPSPKFDALGAVSGRGSAAEFNCNVTMPDDFPESMKADFAAFVANWLNHVLMKGTNGLVRDGTPAT